MTDDSAPENVNSKADATPRASREALFLGAVIEKKTEGSAAGRIRNISPTGALLETPDHLEVGETIVISFRGVDCARAVVKRKTPKGYGIHFAGAIDPTNCRLPTSPAAPPNEFVLNLREGYRRRIWDNTGEAFKRPGTK